MGTGSAATDPASSAAMTRVQWLSISALSFGFLLSASGCGGSSSETPLPLEPVPHPADSATASDPSPAESAAPSDPSAPAGTPVPGSQ